ncbi:hypothetical protein BOH72_01625 [Mycobacterium sp. WY10]|nr:hypothetical protein BOH72_01625 [Mycobacterium sp. WY10]
MQHVRQLPQTHSGDWTNRGNRFCWAIGEALLAVACVPTAATGLGLRSATPVTVLAAISAAEGLGRGALWAFGRAE